MTIEGKLVSMDAPELTGIVSKEEIVRFLLDKQQEIESHFPNDEFIKLDMTHGEIIGMKSTAVISLGNHDIPVGDLPAMDWTIRLNAKYKDAEMINLGNVKMLYEEFKDGSQ